MPASSDGMCYNMHKPMRRVRKTRRDEKMTRKILLLASSTLAAALAPGFASAINYPLEGGTRTSGCFNPNGCVEA